MSTTRRQFVQSLALAPFVPGISPAAKPLWYVDPSDPIFDTPVLATSKAWAPMRDLTDLLTVYPDQTPLSPDHRVSLRELSLDDPRMALDRVGCNIGDNLVPFAKKMSGAPGAQHVWYELDDGNALALAVASRHFDKGVDVEGTVCSFRMYWDSELRRAVRLGDILSLHYELLQEDATDEEYTGIRERILDLFVFGSTPRVFDLTHEDGSGRDQVEAFVDFLDSQGRPDLIPVVHEVHAHALWQVEHTNDSAAQEVFLAENVHALIPKNGHWGFSTSIRLDDLRLYAEQLAQYRETYERCLPLFETHKVVPPGRLNSEELLALHEHLEWVGDDPDYQLFTNYEIETKCPNLRARIHVLEGACLEEVDAAREAYYAQRS